MQLKKYKENIKIGALTAISMLPIYNVAKYFYDMKKIKDVFDQNNVEIAKLENIINSMPQNVEEYEEFIDSSESDILRVYDNALFDVKEKGQFTEEFLSKNNFKSEDDYYDKLDQLYLESQNGNLEAKDEFNALATSGNNDFYFQASEIATQDFMLELNELQLGDIDLGLTDYITLIGVKEFVVAIASVGALALISCKISSLKKSKANSQMINSYKETLGIKDDKMPQMLISDKKENRLKKHYKKDIEEEYLASLEKRTGLKNLSSNSNKDKKNKQGEEEDQQEDMLIL